MAGQVSSSEVKFKWRLVYTSRRHPILAVIVIVDMLVTPTMVSLIAISVFVSYFLIYCQLCVYKGLKVYTGDDVIRSQRDT